MRYSEIPRDLADRHTCKSKVGRDTKTSRSLSSTGGHNESYDGDGDDGYEQLSSSDGNVSQPNQHEEKALDGSIDTPLIEDGIFLTDIIYIDLMHPNKSGEESYARETKMNNVLRVLSSYQSSNYTFISPVPPTLRYLQSRRYIDELQNIFEEDQYKSSEQSSSSSSASSSRHAKVADGLNKMRHLLDDSYVESKRANSIAATGSGGSHSSDQESEHPTALQLVELEPITSGNLVEGYLKRKTVLNNERSNFKKEPSKIFPLEGWTAEESDLPLQDEFFQLVNYNHGHAYRFKSGSNASANRWLAALKQVTTPKPAEPLSISLNLISFE
uniref:PH domain-containing protein n=1 Tax=Anopheles merus TaxID=30066 RepID=A0A182VD30_ANOME